MMLRYPLSQLPDLPLIILFSDEDSAECRTFGGRLLGLSSPEKALKSVSLSEARRGFFYDDLQRVVEGPRESVVHYVATGSSTQALPALILRNLSPRALR